MAAFIRKSDLVLKLRAEHTGKDQYRLKAASGFSLGNENEREEETLLPVSPYAETVTSTNALEHYRFTGDALSKTKPFHNFILQNHIANPSEVDDRLTELVMGNTTSIMVTGNVMVLLALKELGARQHPFSQELARLGQIVVAETWNPATFTSNLHIPTNV